jgi:hypothetical protein
MIAGSAALVALAGLVAPSVGLANEWGQSWLLDPEGSPDAISCASVDYCVAVGAGANFETLGNGWFVASFEAGETMSSISCPAVGYCVAVGQDGGVREEREYAWSASQRPDGYAGLSSVSCGSISFCMAVGWDGAMEYEQGSWVASSASDSEPLVAVSCPTEGFCMAVDGGGRALAYEHGAWGSPMAASVADRLVSISCTSTTFCMAMDADGNAVVYTEEGWRISGYFGSSAGQSAVSCAERRCLAVDGGETFMYEEGSWQAEGVADPRGTLTALSCVSAVYCVAVDAKGDVFYFRGVGWSGPEPIAGGFDSISCTGSGFCMVVDRTGRVLTRGEGRIWQYGTVEPAETLTAVSCASSAFCAVTEAQGGVLVYRRGLWEAYGEVDEHTMTSISCPAEEYCVAADTQGNVVSFDGASWSTTEPVDGSTAITSVSCAAVSFCIAVDADGRVLSYDGMGWSAPQEVAPSVNTYIVHGLESVSCPSRSFCVAVGEAEQAVIYEDGTWSEPVQIVGAGTLSSVACAAPDSCIAGDGNGVLSYDGVGWRQGPASSPPNLGSVDSVSCAGAAECIAVSSGGYEMTYLGSPGPAPVDTVVPAIAGTAEQGSTLEVQRGNWTGEPTGFSYQWLRCDRWGVICQPISGANSTAYVLTASDVGSTLRVQETASNSSGAGLPVRSPASALVLAAPSEVSPVPLIGTAGNGASVTVVSQGEKGGVLGTRTALTASSATLFAGSAPRGPNARVATLLHRDGFAFTFSAPGAGLLTATWYRAGKKGSPLVVARGTAEFSAAKARAVTVRLTARGRRLLQGASKLPIVVVVDFEPTAGAPLSSRESLTLRR